MAKKKRQIGVRYFNGKKYIENEPYVYKLKENAHYECVEAQRDNRHGMGDPFLFRIVKRKKGYVAYLHSLPPKSKKG